MTIPPNGVVDVDPNLMLIRHAMDKGWLVEYKPKPAAPLSPVAAPVPETVPEPVPEPAAKVEVELEPEPRVVTTIETGNPEIIVPEILTIETGDEETEPETEPEPVSTEGEGEPKPKKASRSRKKTVKVKEGATNEEIV